MIILSIIIAIIQSQQIKPIDYARSFIQVQSLIHYDLKINQNAIIYTYPRGAIYKSNIQTNNSNLLCNVQHDTMILTNNLTKQIISKDKMEQDKNDQIINAFQLNKQLGLITEQNYFIQFNLETLEIIHKYPLTEYLTAKQQFQKGVFSPELNMTFLFYQNILLIQNNQGTITSQIIQEMNITKILCNLGYIFISTNEGFLVYWIDVENQIVLLRNIIDKNETIIDIQISTQGEYIYLLKKDGIHIYRILFDSQKQIQILPYSILQFIPIEFSFAFNQNNDKSFVVLIKPQKSVIFLDLEINLVQGIWFVVNTHNLKIDAQSLEINNNYVIIKGSETHSIIRHSQPNIFTNIFNQYPFTLAHVIKLNFYEFIQKDTIFGIDTDSITFFLLDQIDGNILCSTNDTNLIGQNFGYQVQSNLSDCEKKQQYSGEIESKDLIVCQFNIDIELNVISENLNDYRRQLLIIISICLGLALLLSIIGLICYGRKTKKQLNKYQQQLKQYQQFQSDQNESNRTKQTPQKVDNNFKIDEFEQ